MTPADFVNACRVVLVTLLTVAINNPIYLQISPIIDSHCIASLLIRNVSGVTVTTLYSIFPAT